MPIPTRFLALLKPEQVHLLGQVIRYFIAGGIVTSVHLGIYWGLAQHGGVPPQIANIVAQFFSTTLGYNIHSRWSFRGHGRRDNLARTGGRFLIVTAFGFALNSFWVFLFTDLLNGPVWWPMPAIAVLTPGFVYLLNRQWVFA